MYQSQDSYIANKALGAHIFQRYNDFVFDTFGWKKEFYDIASKVPDKHTRRSMYPGCIIKNIDQ